MTDFFEIFFLGLFIVLSAFFSGTETALTSLGKLKLKELLNKLHKIDKDRALALEYWNKESNRVLIALLIGNNIVNIAASSLMTLIVYKFFKNHAFLNVSDSLVAAVSTGVMTMLLLVFAEITPKTISKVSAEKVTLRFIKIIIAYTKSIGLLIDFFNMIVKFVMKIFKINVKRTHDKLTEEELLSLVDVGYKEGILEEDEFEMLNAVMEFDKITVKEIMVPRVDMICLDINDNVEKIIRILEESGHSRFPVYKDNIDNITGIFYTKDLVKLMNKDLSDFKLENFLREPLFVPESKKIDSLLELIKTKKIHLAVVVDEYGGTSGLITIENILEEIVGEIQDEFEKEEEFIKQINADTYLIDAKTDIDLINKTLSLNLPEEPDESLGGFIIRKFDYIPQKGEKLVMDNIEFHIQQADKTKIEKIILIKKNKN